MKRCAVVTAGLSLMATAAHAGVMETITAIGSGVGNIFTQHPITSLIVAAVLIVQRMVPDDKVKEIVGNTCRTAGRWLTLRIASWKYIGAIWNQTVEAFAIKFFRNVVIEGAEQFIEGMLSDNQ